MQRERQRSVSRPSRRQKAQPDKQVKAYISKIIPMTRVEACDFDCYADPPASDPVLQKRHQDETRSRMVEYATMALAARRAADPAEANRLDIKLSVLKCMMGMTQPTSQQLAAMRQKKEQVMEKLKNTRARMKMLDEQEAELLEELERLKDYVAELDEQRREEENGLDAAMD